MYDPYWQPLSIPAGTIKPSRILNILDASVRLVAGKHLLPPIDFTDLTMKILYQKHKDAKPLAYQIDGERKDSQTDKPYTLLPGQAFVARQSSIPVRSLIVT
jgi:hypothetical protein